MNKEAFVLLWLTTTVIIPTGKIFIVDFHMKTSIKRVIYKMDPEKKFSTCVEP